jgi:uncharacterized integral membrane protein
MRTRRRQTSGVAFRGSGLFWGFVLALPLAAALIVFVAQNTSDVTVHWTVWKVTTPLAVVVLVSIFIAVVLAELVGVIWRLRRRQLLSRQAGAERVADVPGAPPVEDVAAPAATGEGPDDGPAA